MLSNYDNMLWYRLLLSGPEKEKVNKEALELSLKYSFVTPLTSMVVTKPQGEKSVLHKPKEGVTPLSQGRALCQNLNEYSSFSVIF